MGSEMCIRDRLIRVKHTMNYKIDNLQYCNWSRKIFEINRSAGLDAVHVTIVDLKDFPRPITILKIIDFIIHSMLNSNQYVF